ncbi:hypothetical protein [Neorhizobium sp. NCHU2750]|nr:hypothetical protein NCHU2750_52020 [Neorhizobium sp. NCHU2750]
MLDVSFIITFLLAQIIDLVLPGSNFQLDSLNGPTRWPIPGAFKT